MIVYTHISRSGYMKFARFKLEELLEEIKEIINYIEVSQYEKEDKDYI